ncbi:MAG: hypothetical protein KDD82_15740 [Planctomycetes bacterium]|nr:hypothetical protein [Planctomycetota bacterium]
MCAVRFMGRSFWTLILPLACAAGVSGDELSAHLARVRVGDPPAWDQIELGRSAADWLRLLRAADDPRVEVQRGAIVVCGWDPGGPAEVDALLQQRASRPGPTQDAALVSLAARERYDALRACLLEAVRSDDPRVALDRLALLRSGPAVGALCRKVFGAEGYAPEVQLAVLRRLGELERSELGGWSKQFSRQVGVSGASRRLACVALVAELRIGARELDEAALHELLQAMVDLDLELYPDAVAGLRLFDRGVLLASMRGHLVRGGSRHRFRLFAGLKELGLARDLRAELEEIALDRDEGPWIRQGAIDALEGVAEASPALARLLEQSASSPDQLALQRQIVSQFAQLPYLPEQRAAVEGLLGSSERTLRIEALHTLAAWASVESQPVVRKLLAGARSPYPGERVALLEAARTCGAFDPESLRVIRDWTREASEPALAQALLAYARDLPDLTAACSILIELLDFRALGQELLGTQVRADAAQALRDRTKAPVRYDARVQPFDARGRERWLEWWRSHQRERNQ